MHSIIATGIINLGKEIINNMIPVKQTSSNELFCLGKKTTQSKIDHSEGLNIYKQSISKQIIQHPFVSGQMTNMEQKESWNLHSNEKGELWLQNLMGKKIQLDNNAQTKDLAIKYIETCKSEKNNTIPNIYSFHFPLKQF